MPELYGPGRRQVDLAALRAAAAQDRRQPGDRLRWGRVAAGLVGALGLAVAAGIGWSSIARPGPAAEVAGPPVALVDPGVDATAWADVLGELDARRAAAFAGGGPALLEMVYAAGSPPLAADVASMDDLTTAGLSARGLIIEVIAVRVVAVAPGRVDLAVRDRLAAYDLVDADGQVIEHRPARGEREWLVTVVPAPAGATPDTYGWRISAIEPAPSATSGP